MNGNRDYDPEVKGQIPRRSLLKRGMVAPLGLAATTFSAKGVAAARSASLKRASTPTPAANTLPVEAPSALGIDAKVLQAILDDVQGGGHNIHSLLVLRHGKLAAELYRRGSDRSLYSLWSSRRQFTRADLHDMRSVSKGIVGLLYGILLHQGAVPAIDTPVSSLYPQVRALNDDARQAICICHLLTMTAGLEWTEPSPVRRASWTDEIGLAISPSAYRCVFQRDVVAKPGSVFTYSGGLTAVLAEIMERSTQRPLHQIARESLFEPLGISDFEWIADVTGKPMAAAGLRLRPRDLITIGAMMLKGGEWQGRQIVPAEWIAQSTTPHIKTAPVGGYGYQWWSMTTQWKGKDLAVAAAIGNGGQRLFLVPHLDLALVSTAGDYGDPAIAAPLNAILHSVVKAVTV